MSATSARRIDQILASGPPAGPFFLHGDAVRLRDEAARHLADAALDPATRDFNFDQFRAADVTPEALASSLAMPPVMAERRVVLLHDAERLTPTGCKVIESAIEKLPSDVALIVTATIPKGSKKAFYRRMMAAAVSVEFRAPRDSELPGWVVERAESRFDRSIDADAAQALADAVGGDLGVIDAELEKLAAASESRIGLDLVARLVSNVREVNRWAWIDDVLSRRYERARSQLPDLLAARGESAVGLLIALVEQHLLVGVAVDGGAAALGRALDRSGKGYLKFKTRAMTGQARHWTTAEIDRAVRALERADRRAKTGASDVAAMDELLLTLAAQSRLARA